MLEYAFYETGDYEAITSREDARCFLIGRTGSGKSATLQYLEDIMSGKVIRITPEDLSLPYIVDLSVIRHLDSLDINLDLLFIALWKHVLLVELIRHRYKVDSPVAKQNFLANLREAVKRDPAKKEALAYLDEFAGKFWCEADERVREITEKFERRIDEAGKGHLGPSGASLDLNFGTGRTYGTEEKRELVDRYQRVVNDTQLARLNKMIRVLDENILDSPQHQTYVIIDDLDRDWVDERLSNDLIRCLFRTVLDINRIRYLKVLVALRTNIFRELDFGRTGGQEEKFRALVLQIRWNKLDLEGMLNLRAQIAGRRAGIALQSIHDLLPAPNRSRGDALQYILDRTLMRPRDTISFFNECLAVAAGSSQLTWPQIFEAERAYSEKRLLALRDEWKPTYPGIEDVFYAFTKTSMPLSKALFTRYLDEVLLLHLEEKFQDHDWLKELAETSLYSSRRAGWAESYQPLIKMLFDIGFVGLAQTKKERVIYAQDNPRYADRLRNLEDASYFYVHPAYRSALEIRYDKRIWQKKDRDL
ncbi:hypothetical protein EJK15_04210 [Nonomuraea basaltis]|nr:hypothetical protein [Nonomuraea basaltis]TMR99979.1 hypothetical protein EJK15_04210 [Nonomuraea basaltis]